MLRLACLAFVLSFLASPAARAASDAERKAALDAYTACLTTAARLLEPSADPASDVARAAMFLCQNALSTAQLALPNPDQRSLDNLKAYGQEFAAAQSTIARACRVGKKCRPAA